MSAWPADVPFFNLRGGYGFTEPDNLIRTPMDVGPPKARRRTTANVATVTGTAYMTREEYRTARAFVRDTLKSGALTFTAPDLITGVTQTYRMAGPLSLAPMGPGWQVSASLEILP